MEFSRQEYWSGLPFPSPRDLPEPGIEPGSPVLQADSLPAEPPGSSASPACKCGRYKTCRFDPWVRKTPWRRKWQPTPVFFPGESFGQRSLVGYTPWGRKESDITEHTTHKLVSGNLTKLYHLSRREKAFSPEGRQISCVQCSRSWSFLPLRNGPSCRSQLTIFAT